MGDSTQPGAPVRLKPVSITAGFVVFGSVWILVSDWVVTAVVGSPAVTAQAQLVNGLLFVSGSSVFIFGVLSRRATAIREQRETIREDRAEMRELEAEVRDSEKRLSLVLRHITETVFLTDDDGTFTYVCPNVHYIFGYTDEEVREMGCIDELLGEDPTPAGFAAGDLAENIELEITDADGRDHTVLVTINSVSIQDGTKLFTVRDVTDRIESERELAAERKRLGTVVSNAPLILTALAPDGTITVSDGRQLEQIGLDSGEMVGESVYDVFDEYPAVKENADRVLGGESFTTTTHIEGNVFTVWHEPVFENGAVDQAIVVAQDITERVHQEEQFQAFVEGSSDIITVLDSDGTRQYVSPSVERILGYEPDELLDGNAFDLVHPDDRDRLRETFADLFEGETETTISAEYRTRHADGSWCWTESRAIIGDGRILDGYVVNTRDVTDRVQAERELRRMDESRSLALTAAEAGVWEWDVETDEVRWHESCERLFGLEPGTFEGTFEAFADRIHPEDVADVEAALEQAVERDEPFDVTFRIIRDDGVERWIDGRGAMLTDHAGDPERMLGVDVDVTERENRAHRLEQYETIVETAIDPIYAVDPEGTIILANAAFAEAAGCTDEELLGTDITTLLSPEDVEKSLATIEMLTDGTDESGTFEVSLGGPGGTRQYEVNVSVVDAGEGDVTPETVGVARDITELRNRLQQLQVMDRVLRHNLRNDMGVVRGYAETIQRDAPDALATQAKHIVDHSDHLLSLTEKQRKITQVLSRDPELQSADAAARIRELVERLSSEFPDARIDATLPDAAAVLATDGFGTAIEELVRNAIEHTDQDVPTVKIAVTETDSRVEISISDTGPGIPEMDQQVVTGEESIAPLYHGTGLGLWLVSWIVRRSSGTLTFDDNEPTGSVVTITLQKEPASSEAHGGDRQ
jgi:PAS domain S-box-containing protein